MKTINNSITILRPVASFDVDIITQFQWSKKREAKTRFISEMENWHRKIAIDRSKEWDLNQFPRLLLLHLNGQQLDLCVSIKRHGVLWGSRAKFDVMKMWAKNNFLLWNWLE